MDTNYLSDIVGQTALKRRLKIYSGSYNRTGMLPKLLIKAARGSGKTKLVRELKKTLVKPNGDTAPLLEVNCATIKDVDQFFDQVYPVWKNHGAILFLDEAHNLPKKLQEIFLTVLEKDPNPVRTVSYSHRELGDMEYEFDFRKMSIIFATTDHQKILVPLVDRLTAVSMAAYTVDELFEIFELNVKVKVSSAIKGEVAKVFRGHPRACVELAEQLDHYAEALELSYITQEDFTDFCDVMGIYNFGLDDGEVTILRVLGKDGACSLNALVAKTGFSKSAIQQCYEFQLLNKGLMDIDGKRQLTKAGRDFYLKNFA